MTVETTTITTATTPYSNDSGRRVRLLLVLPGDRLLLLDWDDVMVIICIIMDGFVVCIQCFSLALLSWFSLLFLLFRCRCCVTVMACGFLQAAVCHSHHFCRSFFRPNESAKFVDRGPSARVTVRRVKNSDDELREYSEVPYVVLQYYEYQQVQQYRDVAGVSYLLLLRSTRYHIS